jgi:hypothetical protein
MEEGRGENTKILCDMERLPSASLRVANALQVGQRRVSTPLRLYLLEASRANISSQEFYCTSKTLSFLAVTQFYERGYWNRSLTKKATDQKMLTGTILLTTARINWRCCGRLGDLHSVSVYYN